jgi:hypothetical protein
MNAFFRIILISGLASLATGCIGGYGPGYNAGGYGAPPAGGVPPAGGAGDALGGGLQGAVLNALIQAMAASVLNGSIGSQLAPADQNFRLQQLAGQTQSGGFDQARQWRNPQTGASLSLEPVGQKLVDPYTGQTCRDVRELYKLSDGRSLNETRRACQNRQGAWVLTQ